MVQPIKPITTNSSINTDGLRLGLARNSASNVGGSSLFGGHKSNRSGSSITRLTTNNSEMDNQSVRAIDMIPTAKPNVTYADKLWTQIDVLDDVRNMSNEIKQRGSFFSEDFTTELANMKASQQKLLDTMYKQHYNNMKLNEQQKILYKIDKSKLNPEEQVNCKPGLSDDFFNEKITRESIYKKQNFDEMHQYIKEIKSDLNQLGDSMKKFDATISESW